MSRSILLLLIGILAGAAVVWKLRPGVATPPNQPIAGQLILSPLPRELNTATISAMLLTIHVKPSPTTPILESNRQTLLSYLLQISELVGMPNQPDIYLSRDAVLWTIFEANFPYQILEQSTEKLDGTRVVSLKKFGSSLNEAFRNPEPRS
jgi:hypothetical protein